MTPQDLIAQRKAIGLKTYGVELRPNNGRDNLQDAREEAADLCCYLRNEINQRAGIDGSAHDCVIRDLECIEWIGGIDALYDKFPPVRALLRRYSAALRLIQQL